MSEHKIPMHPLDPLSVELQVDALLDANSLHPDERRYVAEHAAAKITEKSSLEDCAEAVSWLAFAHVPQLNARFADMNASRHYANPAEMIREESKRRENKKIGYTGNIAHTHDQLKQMGETIVSEETPAQMWKTVFWGLLFGLGFLALGIYSSSTGAAVNVMDWILNATWFQILFILVTLGLSLYFGFFSIGIILVIALFAIAWIVMKLPGLTSVLLNGVLFVIAGIFLLTVGTYIHSIITYKPLSEEEHRQNQARIAERDALRKEMEDYCELMLAKLEIMKKQFVDHDTAFRQQMQKHLGGNYENGAVYEMFSFLNRYYRKAKK